MPQTYDSRPVRETVNAGLPMLLMLEGNRNRVAINASSDGTVAANRHLVLSTGEGIESIFALIPAGTHLSLPYRDWGPIIKEPIYGGAGLGAMDAILVETFIIPRSLRS